MNQPNQDGQPSNRGHLPPPVPVRVRTGTAEIWYQAHPGPSGPQPEPPLSFLPGWRPRRLPGRMPPEQQIQHMIEQRERELAELRALQLKYPLPAPAAEPA